jgi:hypothetical protein
LRLANKGLGLSERSRDPLHFEECRKRTRNMKDFIKGFLGTWASFSADLNLVIQIAMGIALLAGAFSAQRNVTLRMALARQLC